MASLTAGYRHPTNVMPSPQQAGRRLYLALPHEMANPGAGYGLAVKNERWQSVHPVAHLPAYLGQAGQATLSPVAQGEIRPHPQFAQAQMLKVNP